ncbi:MAG: dethiobiotin synthase [Verrucomicrobiota bacterium]
MKKILFVTGTDTGVGKTVLTAMLLAFLRGAGRDALAMKPFCSGSRGDARLLHDLQKGCLTLDEVNPFYFDKPLAPAAAAKNVPLRAALAKIRELAGRCDILVVEGVGGLLAPLGKGYTVRDLIGNLDCKVIVVSANRLGTINHTLLTVEALQVSGQKELAIAMMGVRKPDISAASNVRMIRRMAPRTPVFAIPYLGFGASKAGGVKKNVIFLKKTLAQLAWGGSVGLVLSQNERG